YAADKARVFRNQGVGDTAVIDVDDPGAAPYAESVAAQGVRVVRVSRERLCPGGAGVRDGMLTLDTPSGWVELLPASELRIRGGHNVTNALAAAAAAAAWGVAPATIACALASFEPIAHRLQPVGVVGEVEYVNDSKATNPGAVIVALDAFRDRAVVLLLGGRNKGSLFDEVADLAADTCRVVVAFGEARQEIVAACIKAGVESVVACSLAEAVGLARVSARSGDVVLLSPGCASFDEFEGYAHRGRVFAELVDSMMDDPV
ncbi:MAG: cyanophycin synthetase, partial [Coriobacteriia bacterium]|nr:cyanophycin synthetase [Coriobacteriia bacterium]